jgi:hypothetical protein
MDIFMTPKQVTLLVQHHEQREKNERSLSLCVMIKTMAIYNVQKLHLLSLTNNRRKES